MLKNFEKKLNEIIKSREIIEKQLSDISLSALERIDLSKKFSVIEQILEKKKIRWSYRS